FLFVFIRRGTGENLYFNLYIYRLLKKHNLVGKEILPMPERKRFAYDQINELWQGDLSHGPTIRVHGKAQKTFLIAYIDDCSRLVPYA
ncbi:hypothetical protein K1S90_26975, partial [Klebsiella pneumoniae]|nr:hypothetical protein [Klebsiella pneumoniae]